jgi:hypothetical protein
VKFSTAADDEPTFVTVALLPGDPVVTVPTAHRNIDLCRRSASRRVDLRLADARRDRARAADARVDLRHYSTSTNPVSAVRVALFSVQVIRQP